MQDDWKDSFLRYEGRELLLAPGELTLHGVGIAMERERRLQQRDARLEESFDKKLELEVQKLTETSRKREQESIDRRVAQEVALVQTKLEGEMKSLLVRVETTLKDARGKSKRRKGDWFAKATEVKSANPNLNYSEVAALVGVSTSTLTRSKLFVDFCKLFRREGPSKGFKLGKGRIEATTPQSDLPEATDASEA